MSILICVFLQLFYTVLCVAFECLKNGHFSDVFRAFPWTLDNLQRVQLSPVPGPCARSQGHLCALSVSDLSPGAARHALRLTDQPGRVGEGETAPGPWAGVNREMQENIKKKYKLVLTHNAVCATINSNKTKEVTP